MTDKFISIEAISKRYPGADGGEIAVFENLWMSMARGEFGCVIGHSGCGKTTVLNILAGLDAPSEGTVIVDGQAIRSCITRAVDIGGGKITTLEGLGSPQAPHPVQAAFIAEQAAQCGYCANGMIMTAAALLAATPHPDEAQIRTELAGNLCRCGSHVRVLAAVLRAAKEG